MDEPAQNPSEPSILAFFKTYRVPIVLGGVSLLCIVVALVLLVKTSQSVIPIQFSHTDEAGSALGTQSANPSTRSGSLITVDVEGAIVRPGIISLPAESRVEDAIVAAGGFTNNADENFVAKNINRAMKVTDGMKVYIPTIDTTSHNLGTVVATPGTSSQNGSMISINLASKAELDSLPGVGPVTAQKIIDNRPYASLDDLVTKKAIGPSLYEKIKNMLSL